MFKIAICDDIDQERTVLHSAINNIIRERTRHAKIIEYSTGEALIDDIRDGYEKFDLFFLDIFMNGITGIDVAREIRKMGISEPLVFLTTSPEFAIEGYDVEASGYLLKPLDCIKLHALIERLLDSTKRNRIDINFKGEIRYIYVDEITFVESSSQKILIHLVDGTIQQTRGKLDDYQKKLDERFLRCHQSYLVNMDYISYAKNDFHMTDGCVVPIRVRSRKQIKDFYHQYFVMHTINKLPEEDMYV